MSSHTFVFDPAVTNLVVVVVAVVVVVVVVVVVHRVWGEEMLAVACSSLAEEMAIPYRAPGGMPVYRLSLTLSFFYKFYLSVSSRVDPASITDSHQNAYKVNYIVVSLYPYCQEKHKILATGVICKCFL